MAPIKENSVAEDQASSERNDEMVLKEAHERLKLAEEGEAEIRRLALEDLEFRAGKQWPEGVQAERNKDGRPCLVINRIPQFIQQVTNDQRQNRPSIKVHPVDDQADVETSKIIQGLIRHIEYNSNADVAYDTAFDSAVSGGFGYLRVATEFCDPMSFDQEILIKRIRNPLSVYFDPHSQEPDGSDANFALIIEDLSPEDYRAKYPGSKLSSPETWQSLGNQIPTWMPEGSARVAEYFCRKMSQENICQLSNGQVMREKELPSILPEGVELVQTRLATIPVIKWYKVNATEVLDETDWVGKWIPIVPVYGNELFINGRRILEGIIRNAKDPQRMYNYWKSAETEAIALAPRAPYLIEEGQLEGYERDWETANRRNHAYLKYKVKSVNGVPIPPPQRQAFEPAVGAITQAAMYAAEDLKSTTGIYDAALGARSNETSGRAILARNNQAQTSNFHFIDNLTRSLRHVGRILVDLIPKIYDTARTARIIGEDGTQRVVKINQPYQEEGKPEPVLYALDTGKYDVTVDVGPSYASKRQEAVASMLDFTRSVPQAAAVIGDLMVRNMDWPGAPEIAERLRKTLPPGLADDPKKPQAQIPPQIQAQMQQMSQMIEKLTENLHQAHDDMDKKRMELESRERIEFKKLEVELEIERAKLDAKDSLAILNAEIAQLNQRMQLVGFDRPMEQNAAPYLDPPAFGAPGAPAGLGPMNPTGGASPGTSMEGNPHVDPSV